MPPPPKARVPLIKVKKRHEKTRKDRACLLLVFCLSFLDFSLSFLRKRQKFVFCLSFACLLLKKTVNKIYSLTFGAKDKQKTNKRQALSFARKRQRKVKKRQEKTKKRQAKDRLCLFLSFLDFCQWDPSLTFECTIHCKAQKDFDCPCR